MTANDFNRYINLQAFCEANGVKDFEYVMLPKFGWFAVNKRAEQVQTLIDFIPPKDLVAFITDLIIEKPQYHDTRISYNETSVVRLANDIRLLWLYKRLHIDCVSEYHEGQVYMDGQYVNAAKMFDQNGMRAFAETGVGLLTDRVLKKYRYDVRLPEVKNCLIIPTWCSPQHFCSFEHCKISNLHHRTSFFINGEKGWYGKPKGTVYGNLTNLVTHEGCTWDYKLDKWVDSVLNLDESLNVNQCLTIWTQANRAKFKRSPLDIIESIEGVGKLKFNLEQLSLRQVEELEKRFAVSLKDTWAAQRQAEVTIGYTTFVAKDMRYHVQLSNGMLQEIANFNIEIDRLVKKDGEFYRQGTIYYEGKQVPFELPNEVFLLSQPFILAINKFFLENGIGVPIISNTYRRHLVDVINRLNVGSLTSPVS